MPSWQSSFFGRLTRMSRPRTAAAETDNDELRRQFAYLSDRFGAIPPGVSFEPGQMGPIKGEWVRVDAASPNRLILYFHGGGYISGSPESHRPLIARLCQAAGATAFSVNYRLAPEFAFPAGLRDGIDAYRHLIQRKIPASSIVLAGDGAGGGLAFGCLLCDPKRRPADAGGRVRGDESMGGPLALSGWSILQNAKNDAALSWDLLFVSARNYLRKTSPADPYASPVFASFKDFPPIMVHAGSLEILRDDASRIGERAAEAGVSVSVEIYDGMQHIFQAQAYVPEARVSLQRLGNFIKSKTPDTADAA